jgi:4-hydroxy-2-oxoheptanedioate aldolase
MEKFHHSIGAADYLQQANDTLITIVQIETKEALASVDDIAAIDGVDVLLIGPFDLGNNIGHPILDGKMHVELLKAIDNIKQAADKHGKRTGIYCTTGGQSKLFADKGFNMISIAADMIALPSYLTSTLREAKGESGPGEEMTGPYGR